MMGWNMKRGDWPLARVMRTMPGKDGVVRKCVVRYNGKEYLRPVARLAPVYHADCSDYVYN